MPNFSKEIQKNWLVLLFVVVQAIFVVGVKSAQIDEMDDRLDDLEKKYQVQHELIIEMHTDIKWIKGALSDGRDSR
jgi:hypothetical protein